MVRLRKHFKAKEPVHLRFKKLRNGNISLYLDIYDQGQRSYEFLKMYLVPGTDAISRKQNKSIIDAANAIKAHRIIDISNKAAGIHTETKVSRITLQNWADIHYRKTETTVSESTKRARQAMMGHLIKYGADIPMSKIDKAYCAGFVDRLQNLHLSKGSICIYMKHFSALLNSAVREDIISVNPIKKMEKTGWGKQDESKRAFLTIEEVKKLIDTTCKRECVKQIFLFACFCGLRWSDVSRLKWENIECNNGHMHISTIMQKTKKQIYIPISHTAERFIPAMRGTDKDTSLIFSGLPSIITVRKDLRQWAADAGIKKDITFHVSRHTFATTSLTLGADLFTTSKLLGHTNIKTTQIYAKIINEKKNETIALFDKAFC